MPEGDTLFRTAAVLREVLLGRDVIAAAGRPGGAALARVIGSRIERVDAQGKHLLIGFGNGLTLHTHLRMQGSWHRYRTGERWRRSPLRAVAVVEVAGAVAVCFDAPTVELIDSRALAIHPSLSALGPDLLAPTPDLAAAVARLRAPERAAMPVGEALLDQTALAGLGNVYRSEVCFIERRRSVPAGRGARARRARAAGGDRRAPPGGQPAQPRPHHDARCPGWRTRQRARRVTGAGPRGGAAPLGLRPHRPALPALRDAHPQRRHRILAAPHLVVSDLPATAGVIGASRHPKPRCFPSTVQNPRRHSLQSRATRGS